MLRLLHKINSRLSRTASKEVQQPTLPIKPGAGIEPWSPAEVELLLHCERNPIVFDVRTSSRTIYQTCIIGVDLASNELLLDPLFPAPPIEQRAADRPFWIRATLRSGALKSGSPKSGTYAICVAPVSVIAGQGILVQILATQFEAADTLEIDYADGCGPRIELQAHDGHRIHGTMTKLSTRGACIAVTDGSGHRAAVITAADCSLIFNPHFTIHCDGRVVRSVKQPARKRKLVYLQFDSMPANDKSQLIAYLQACRGQAIAA